MRKVIANMKIKNKIFLALSLPIIGLIYFSGAAVWERINTTSDMDILSQQTQLSVHLSNLVHELQKERGVTAFFLSSGEKKIGAELSQQRSKTNSKRNTLKNFYATLDTGQSDITYRKQLDNIFSNSKQYSDLMPGGNGSATKAGVNRKAETPIAAQAQLPIHQAEQPQTTMRIGKSFSSRCYEQV